MEITAIDNQSKKKRSNLILHIDVEITLGTVAGILWVNIPNIGGIIAGYSVLAIMLLYFFLVLNPRSNFSLWLDGIAEKINKKSLTRKPKSRLYGIAILCIGFIDFIPYYFLYYKAEFYIIACLIMICGAITKFVGLFEIYGNTKSTKSQIFMTYVIMLGIWIIGSQLLYYTILFFKHTAVN